MPRWLNVLAIFLPIAAALEIAHSHYQAAWATPTWIFLASVAAIIPAAGWMGHATEHLGARLGEGIGGLLNATFGNAAELIIAGMALLEASRNADRAAAMHEIVKASLTGSIIGNVLLVFGLAVLIGGLRFQQQSFNATAGRVGSTLMMLATIALLLPALFAYMLPADQAHLSDISLEFSVLMLVVYGLSLLFSLITHRGYYQGSKAVGEEHEREAHWSVTKSLLVLLGATVCVGLLAEFMIGSVHEASHNLGLSDVFVGVIVVAIVGNAAEHSTAIIMAWRNRMDLALAIAVGSSIQIALFVAPALVLFSHAVGPRMNLVFSMPEMVAVFVCVWVISQIAVDGESNWLEGVLMLSVYIMLGLLFFYLPGGQPAPAP